ncbi:SRPBCC domain-containing protein [Silvimonas sp.]|uniref:SRPBCC domain-containing protein n=1 Tax=Silvimonas sp. TaxID=2650811 RepID=UPI002844BA06|nr:SRPBCC domain-containing protein [Silvimonas sp.]MDR3426169.1 SRPBCC domain-containing protein [Silvimonas sp.]
MPFQPEPGMIRWKMHFISSPAKVFAALATDAGRARFWAESAPENRGMISFHMLNYAPFAGRVLAREEPWLFVLAYFGTIVKFSLQPDGAGGTELLLVATEVTESARMEMAAGWVSVLMAMKAAVDHGVDLRNHDANRSWLDGYADN